MSTQLKILLGGIAGAAMLIAGSTALYFASTPPPPNEPELGGRLELNRSLVDGLERSWLVYEPPNLSDSAPVVFVLPGSGQSGEAMREFTAYRYEQLASQDGALVVYAEAWEEGGGLAGHEWNECRKNTPLPAHLNNVDDVGFILWVLEQVAARYSIDRSRVYVAGHSDGGQMTFRLAAEHPEVFGAFAVSSAQQAAPTNSNCRSPSGPVSLLIMNGTEDPIVPYRGGVASFYGFAAAGEVQSMENTIAHWKKVNAIDVKQVAKKLEFPDTDNADSSKVRRESYLSPTGHRLVVYHVVGGGHAIPGGYRNLPDFVFGPINHDINGVDEIWKFFFGETAPH